MFWCLGGPWFDSDVEKSHGYAGPVRALPVMKSARASMGMRRSRPTWMDST
jgi:hypothetical protein